MEAPLHAEGYPLAIHLAILERGMAGGANHLHRDAPGIRLRRPCIPLDSHLGPLSLLDCGAAYLAVFHASEGAPTP